MAPEKKTRKQTAAARWIANNREVHKLNARDWQKFNPEKFSWIRYRCDATSGSGPLTRQYNIWYTYTLPTIKEVYDG